MFCIESLTSEEYCWLPVQTMWRGEGDAEQARDVGRRTHRTVLEHLQVHQGHGGRVGLDPRGHRFEPGQAAVDECNLQVVGSNSTGRVSV